MRDYEFDPVNIHVDVVEPGIIDPGEITAPPTDWSWLFWLGLAGFMIWAAFDKKGGFARYDRNREEK